MTKLTENVQLMKEFDKIAIEKAKNSYIQKKPCSESGIDVFHEPYAHCILPDLVNDLDFINDTKDLGDIKSPSIKRFRDEILYGSVRKLIEELTGIKLSYKIDVTSSKYEHTDCLLCHDDDIHDDKMKNGRRIAFIYYLVPSDWDESDGGHLDLFKVNDNLQPTEIFKSIKPRFNSLLFFEVSDRSFHQVAEVLSKSKCRLSINGWFHGEINPRPIANVEPIPEPLSLKEIDPQKYSEVSEALRDSSIVWTSKGPANRRNYEIAEANSLPTIVTELLQVLTSDFMGLSLSNMTGLALHWSIKKLKEEELDEDDYDDDFSEDEEDHIEENSVDEIDENSVDEVSDTESDSSEENSNLDMDISKRKNNFSMMNPKFQKTSSSSKTDEESPGTSASKTESEATGSGASSSAAVQENDDANHEFGKPKYHCEVRRWKQGNYTLVTDDDKENKTKALDLMVNYFKGKQLQ